jgi:hypothetical protein
MYEAKKKRIRNAEADMERLLSNREMRSDMYRLVEGVIRDAFKRAFH